MHQGRRSFALIAGVACITAAPLAPRALGCQASTPERVAGPAAQPAPDPKLQPDEVVAIILRALQHNDAPRKDAGIALTFEFASPDNKAATGPLAKFVELVKNPTYAPLLNHRSVDRSPLHMRGEDGAEQRVVITDAKGARALFVFTLSKQRGDACKGCWMTDAVVRQELPRVPGIGTSGG